MPRAMTDLFIRLHLFLARHRGAVFALTGLFILASVWFARV